MREAAGGCVEWAASNSEGSLLSSWIDRAGYAQGTEHPERNPPGEAMSLFDFAKLCLGVACLNFGVAFLVLGAILIRMAIFGGNA